MPTQTVSVTLEVPEGWEVEAIRPPKCGEHYVCCRTEMLAGFDHQLDSPQVILRRVWQPPAWLLEHYEGCWVWRSNSGERAWYVSHKEPTMTYDTHYWGLQGCPGFDPPRAHDLAALHNTTFTPPPTNKIQVKR